MVRYAAYLLAGLIVFGVIVGVLTSQKNKALKQAAQEKIERERLERRSEGLEILVNAGNTAAETERLKDKANAQTNNSNLANRRFNDARDRDSGTLSGNYNAARERFCDNFPDDSACR